MRNWSGQGCVLSFLNRRSILYKKGDVGITRLDNSGLRSELIREEDAENIIVLVVVVGITVFLGKALYDAKLLWITISYNDYHEGYYHAFLAGAF